MLGDLAILLYVFEKFTNKEKFDQIAKRSLEILSTMPQYSGTLTPQIIQQLYELMVNTLLTMSFVVIILHLLINFLYWKDKKGAIAYLRLQTIVGFVGSLLLGLDGLFQLHFLQTLFILLGFAYFYSFSGMGYFKSRT